MLFEFVMLFFCSNYAKIICFLPNIMPNYSKICLIMLRTRSAYMHAHQHSRPEQVPVLQKSISKGIQPLSRYRCKPNSITEACVKEKRKEECRKPMQ